MAPGSRSKPWFKSLFFAWIRNQMKIHFEALGWDRPFVMSIVHSHHPAQTMRRLLKKRQQLQL